MEERIFIRLTGPAKIEGIWRKPGEDVAVTPAIARDLAQAGAIAEGEAGALTDLASGMPGFDKEVRAVVDAATADLIGDRAAARARAAEAEAEVSRQAARLLELEVELGAAEERNAALAAELAALKAATATADAGDTPPAPAETATAPKNARKKGSGAEQG